MAAFDEAKKGYPCNTCQAVFSSVEKVKSHYKGDWHVFNSKRRAHELVPLSKADFKAIEHTVKKPTSPKKTAPAAKKEEMTYRTMKKLAREGAEEPKEEDDRKGDAVPLSWGGITADTTEEMAQIAKGMGIAPERIDNIVKMAVSRRDEEVASEQKYREKKRAAFLKAHPEAEAEAEAEEVATSAGKEAAGEGEGEEEQDGVEEEGFVPETGPNASIFDRRVFDTPQENLAYMLERYGFFVPDQDILCDIDGLLEYLNEKVKLGGYCLFCQRQFVPGVPCQQHMIDRGHCKVAYTEGVDLDEFEDFYDYDSANADLPVDEEGNPMSREAKIDGVTGELTLPNGKTLGHRQYKVFYKQHYEAEDNRPSVVAAKREELLRLGIQVGHDYTEEDIVAMPDMQVMGLVVKYHKARRKEMALQQRAKLKDEMRAKRGDYQVKASKLRSSEQRTQIIRDYHGGLQ